MKNLTVILTAAALAGCVSENEPDPNRLVARTDFEVAANWNLRPVGGLDYFPMFNAEYELAKRPQGGCTDCPLLQEAVVGSSTTKA